MAEQKITLHVAGLPLSLTVESEKEELYRLAEREVKHYFKEVQNRNYKGWTKENYLAMTALQFAINYVNQRSARETDSDDLRRLNALSAEIDSYLNRPGE